MDPGASMFAVVAGSTQLPKQTTKKTCNCRPGAINFCPRKHDFSTSKIMDETPTAVTKKDFRSLTNIFSSFNIGSSKKQARKKAKTQAWRESIRVHKQVRAEKKLARQQKKADKLAKREEKLRAKYGDAYLDPSDTKRKGSIAASSMEVDEKVHFEEDDNKDSVVEDVPKEDDRKADSAAVKDIPKEDVLMKAA